MTPVAMRRAFGACLLGAAALVALSTGRMVRDGKASFEEGLKLADAGDALRAASAFEDAARSYAPGSPYPGRALDRLSIMARASEMRGDPETARHLWEVVRRSILSTRHLWQPNEEILARAEGSLAKLGATAFSERSEGTAAAARGAPPRPKDPSPFASLLLFAGLLSWIAGAAWLCGVAKSEAHARSRRAAWTTSLCGLALWLIMAWFAG
jgi:hypothetical protein